MGRNIVLVNTCTALIIREINISNVPTYKEFNVIIFDDVCLWSRDSTVTQIQDDRHFNRKLLEDFVIIPLQH